MIIPKFILTLYYASDQLISTLNKLPHMKYTLYSKGMDFKLIGRRSVSDGLLAWWSS